MILNWVNGNGDRGQRNEGIEVEVEGESYPRHMPGCGAGLNRSGGSGLKLKAAIDFLRKFREHQHLQNKRCRFR